MNEGRGYKRRSKEADIAFGMGKIQGFREVEAELHAVLARVAARRERSRAENAQRETAA